MFSKKGRIIKRSIACIVITCFMMCFLPISDIVAYATTPKRLEIKDNFLSVSINTKNGRFAVRTTGGLPNRPSDDNKQITYEKDVPETSFTSFRFNGKDFIYGNSYGTPLVPKTSFQEPTQEGNKFVSTWIYKDDGGKIDVSIKQTLELISKSSDKLEGNVWVKYEIQNNAEEQVSIGSRILFDVTAGNNDAPILIKAGDVFPIKGERMFTGLNVPLYWQAVDNWDNPTISSYGLLYGWGEAKPDKVIFGHWNSLSGTKFDYEYNEWLDYDTNENMFGSADSAVAIYWEDLEVPAGQTLTLSTMIGMGDLESRKIADGLSLNITAPKKVLVPEDETTIFDISAEIDNSFPGARDLNDLRIMIDVPGGVSMIEGNYDTWLSSLKKNEIHTINWKFRPGKIEGANAYAFTVKVFSEEKAYLEETAYVIALPSFIDPPKMQYNLISPDKMYKDEVYRKIVVKGDNLNYLKGNESNWDVYLKDPNGKRINVPDSSVTVESNTEISIFLPDNLQLGYYGLGLEYFLSDDNIVGFYRDKAFEITNDISTMRRGYGTLLITQKETQKSHGAKKYTHVENFVYHTKGNQAVTVPAGEKEVLRITGNIQQLDENTYSIIPAANRPVYLGKMLKLTTESGSAGVGEMTVKTYEYEYKDEIGVYDKAQRVEISGNDRSRIYLEAPLKGVPNELSKPLVWEGNFKFTADEFVIKRPNLWGVNAQISKFKIGV